MIFSKEYVGYLSRQVVKRLQASHFIQTKEPEKVTEQVQASMIEELSLEEVEGLLVQKAMARYSGNVSEAARALGLSRAALYRRLEKHRI